MKDAHRSDIQIYGASDVSRKTYGSTVIEVDLGLRRVFKWRFLLADVTKVIIGAHFLQHFGLMLDLQNSCLRDQRRN